MQPTDIISTLDIRPSDVPTSDVPVDGEFQTRAPLVSVVIPAYKVAAFVSETLASVFAQTFTDFEVIVINDGSPDTQEFERAIEPYRERIRYITQENRGASAARNAGLSVASGELIAFLDADDLWSPSYLEEQVKFIHTVGCDVACADALIFGDGPDAGKSYMETLMGTEAATGEATFLELLSAEKSFITSGVVARRKPILEIGLFDEELKNAQDFDLWLRLARHGARLAYQRKMLLKYRCRQGSLSGDAINLHRREIRVFDKVEQSYPLTSLERAEVSEVIRTRRALLEYELGKLYLLPGDFARARQSFAKSNRLSPALKPKLALWLTCAVPHLMKFLYARRLEKADAK